MNRFENWFCSSSIWRFVTERKLLPWMLSGYALGDHVLEVGAGPGATTDELLRRAGRVTSLEYDPSFREPAGRAAQGFASDRRARRCGDACRFPIIHFPPWSRCWCCII